MKKTQCEISKQSCPSRVRSSGKNSGLRWDLGFCSTEEVAEVQGVNEGQRERIYTPQREEE